MAWKPRKGKAAQEVEEEEEADEDEDEDEEDDFANLPKCVLKRVTVLRNMHMEYEEIDAAYKQERIALENKYLAMKVGLQTKRTDIISGAVEVPADTPRKFHTLHLFAYFVLCAAVELIVL
jgi:hypothetical protein